MAIYVTNNKIPDNYKVTLLREYDINSSILSRISSAVLNTLKFIIRFPQLICYEAKALVQKDLKYDKNKLLCSNNLYKGHLVKQISKHENLGRAIIDFAKNYINMPKASIVDNPTEENLAKDLGEKKIVTIPVIAKGFFRDHISTLRINPNNKTILFYDPKGKTLKEIADCDLKVNLESFKVKELWRRIQAAIPDLSSSESSWPWRLIENTHRYQKDARSCGVHFYYAAIKPEQLPEPIEQSQMDLKREGLMLDVLTSD